MARKPTFFANIFTDWNPLVRSDITRTQWESEVDRTLRDFVLIPPCKTSRSVLDAIQRTGKTVYHYSRAGTRYCPTRAMRTRIPIP